MMVMSDTEALRARVSELEAQVIDMAEVTAETFDLASKSHAGMNARIAALEAAAAAPCPTCAVRSAKPEPGLNGPWYFHG